MSDRTLSIKITAKDDASKVFQTIAKSSDTLAKDLKEAGDEGAKSFDKLEQEARQAIPAIDQVSNATKRSEINLVALGGAIGTAVGSMAQLGQMYRDQERQISGIEALYGDQSAAILQMSENIQDFTRYSNDAARESALFASSLVTNYQMSAEQVALLVERSADLAQIYGVDLVDAVTRTSGAIRGEGEAAERLGLNLSDAAIAARALDAGITNWNVPGALSEAEKAAFRFELFLQDTEKTVGQAAAAADNAGGHLREFANELQDAGQSIGGFLGPVGQMAAEMAPLTLALPLAGAGLGKLAAGMNAARLASLGFIATPVGAAVTAIGVGLGVVTKLWMDNKAAAEEAAAANAAYAESVDELNQVINDLGQGSYRDATWARQLAKDVENEIGWLMGNLDDVVENFSYNDGSWFDKLVRKQMAADGFDMSRDDLAIQWAQVANELYQSMLPQEHHKRDFNEAFGRFLDLKDVLSPTQWAAYKDQVDLLFDAFNAGDGEMSVDTFLTRLDRLTDAAENALSPMERLTRAQTDLGQSMQVWQDLGAGSIGTMTEEYGVLSQNVADAALSTEELTEAEAARLEVLKLMADETAKAQTAQDIFWSEEKERTRQEDEATRQRVERKKAEAAANKALWQELWADQQAHNERVAKFGEIEIRTNRGVAESISDVKAAYEEMAAVRQEQLLGIAQSLAGMDNPLDRWNASSGATPYSQIAMDVRDTSSALGDLERILIGNTNAYANQTSGINDWAEALIGVKGEYAAIDDLLANRRISIDEYNAAQEAQISIAESNLAVQEHVQTIQAMQAPLIAQQTSALEEQLGIIAGYEPALQLTALAWMDSATAAKAMEIATLATAAANGELGASGKAAFTSYLEGLALVDPAMKSLLIDMGLISEGADGTITVHLDGAESAMSDFDRMIDRLDVIIRLLGGMPPIDMEDLASGKLDDVYQKALQLDGQEATVTADANDPAAGILLGVQAILDDLDGDTATTTAETIDLSSSVIESIRDALASLDGRKATTIIETVYQSRGVSGAIKGARHGGVIPAFAHGGVVPANLVPVWTSEAGTEIAHFANGGSVALPGEGMRFMPPGTYISPANANTTNYGGATVHVTVNVAGSVTSEHDLTVSIAQAIVPALTDVIQDVRNGQVSIY